MTALRAAVRHDAVAGEQPPSEDRAGSTTRGLALEAICRDEAPRLRRFFARRLPADDVGDFVQETFRRLIGHAPERPAAFLTRIAANLVFERRRAQARRSEALHDSYDDDVLAGPDPIRQLEARDVLRRIDAALLRLKPKTRNIFLLRHIEGMSYAEIAEAYGMSVKGVEKQFAKAITYLRRHVGDL